MHPGVYLSSLSDPGGIDPGVYIANLILQLPFNYFQNLSKQPISLGISPSSWHPGPVIARRRRLDITVDRPSAEPIIERSKFEQICMGKILIAESDRRVWISAIVP